MKFNDYFLKEDALPPIMKVERSLSDTIRSEIKSAQGSISESAVEEIVKNLDVFEKWLVYSFPEIFNRQHRSDSFRRRVLEFCDKWSIGFSGKDYEELYSKISTFYTTLPQIVKKIKNEASHRNVKFLEGEEVASSDSKWFSPPAQPSEQSLLEQVFNIVTGGEDYSNQVYASKPATKLILNNLQSFGEYLVVYFPEYFKVVKDDNVKTGQIHSRVQEFLSKWSIVLVRNGSPVKFYKSVPAIYRQLREFADTASIAFAKVPMRGMTISSELQSIFKQAGIHISDRDIETVDSARIVEGLKTHFPEFIQEPGHTGRKPKPEREPRKQIAKVNRFVEHVSGRVGEEDSSASDMYEAKLNIYKNVPALAKQLRHFFQESRTHGDK